MFDSILNQKEYTPRYSSAASDMYKGQLFNRWELKVFETSVINFEWGADRIGNVLSPGVYFYPIEAKNRCGDIREDGTLHITY